MHINFFITIFVIFCTEKTTDCPSNHKEIILHGNLNLNFNVQYLELKDIDNITFIKAYWYKDMEYYQCKCGKILRDVTFYHKFKQDKENKNIIEYEILCLNCFYHKKNKIDEHDLSWVSVPMYPIKTLRNYFRSMLVFNAAIMQKLVNKSHVSFKITANLTDSLENEYLFDWEKLVLKTDKSLHEKILKDIRYEIIKYYLDKYYYVIEWNILSNTSFFINDMIDEYFTVSESNQSKIVYKKAKFDNMVVKSEEISIKIVFVEIYSGNNESRELLQIDNIELKNSEKICSDVLKLFEDIGENKNKQVIYDYKFICLIKQNILKILINLNSKEFNVENCKNIFKIIISYLFIHDERVRLNYSMPDEISEVSKLYLAVKYLSSEKLIQIIFDHKFKL